jgi:hypothetical protein
MSDELAAMSFLLKGAGGFVFGFAVIYALWRLLLARRPLALDAQTIWLYMGLAFPICIVSEVLIGRLHFELFGAQLWQYRVAPTHGGYTSLYNFAIWPLYGWHVYLGEQALARWNPSAGLRRAVLLLKHASAGPLLEIIANLGMLAILGRYYFYYLPGDLWHLTSIQVVPYYFVLSLLFSAFIARVRDTQHKVAIGCAGYLAGLAYLFLA